MHSNIEAYVLWYKYWRPNLSKWSWVPSLWHSHENQWWRYVIVLPLYSHNNFVLTKISFYLDTLRSIQTLDPEVRTSAEVTFAIKVLTAVNTNNYVKFFKLVRQATLLQVNTNIGIISWCLLLLTTYFNINRVAFYYAILTK